MAKPAFGIQQKRFLGTGFHPKLDTLGIYHTKPLGCDPALYHPKYPDATCIHKKNSIAPWTYKKLLEDYSNNLGHKNDKILRERQEQAGKLGPAWHEVFDFSIRPPALAPEPGKVNARRFSKVARFKDPPHASPGPRVYPREKYVLKHGPHTKIPSFEWDNLRGRFADKEKSWTLAPNRYKVVESDPGSMEKLMKKVVSRKGPYELFTIARIDSTVRGHLAINNKVVCASWPLKLPSELDHFNHPRMRNYGVLKQTGRDAHCHGRNVLIDLALCPRSPSEPGPGSYDILPTCFLPVSPNIYPFNSTSHWAVPFSIREYYPGVGRYTIKCTRHIKGSGWTHCFNSKVSRDLPIPEEMNSF